MGSTLHKVQRITRWVHAKRLFCTMCNDSDLKLSPSVDCDVISPAGDRYS